MHDRTNADLKVDAHARLNFGTPATSKPLCIACYVQQATLHSVKLATILRKLLKAQDSEEWTQFFVGGEKVRLMLMTHLVGNNNGHSI